MSGGGLVFDSSAVLAILREEPGHEQLQEAIERAEMLAIGAPSAGLNYGDCMAYASACVVDLPLLFVGNDFAKTDIPPA